MPFAPDPKLPYGTLSQRSPEYDADTWACLDDFYRGGFDLARVAKKYLPKLQSENPVRYEERVHAAGYVNHLAHIVDKFASAVFSGDFSVTEAADSDDPTTNGTSAPPVYKDFYANADGRQTALRTIAKLALTTALKKGRALIALDLSDAPIDVVNRAQEEAIGANVPRLWEVPIEQLIDWKRDERGGFAWAILNRCIVERDSPTSARGLITEEFKVWTFDDDAGVASWVLYSVSYVAGSPPKPDDFVPVKDSGVTTFTRIPLIELRLPDGLWIGNKIGTLVKEHWQRRTTLVNAENKNLIVVPVVKLGPEISAVGDAMPSEAQQNPGRGNLADQLANRGYMVVGKDDDVVFPGPDTSVYEVADKQLCGLKDEIYRVVDQMAESADNSASTMRRSGDSKSKDREAFETVCASYGQFTRDAIKLAMVCFANARNDNVVWQINGLDKFGSEDREKLVAEGQALDMIPIPSVTFKRLHKTDIALRLVAGASPETKDQIRQEIADGVSAEQEIREIAQDAKRDALLNPPPPPTVVQAPPGKAPPMPPPKQP